MRPLLSPAGRWPPRGRLSITVNLLLLCGSLLIPILLACGVLLHAYFSSEERGLRTTAADHVQNILSVLDSTLGGHLRLLEVLAEHPSLDDLGMGADLAPFARQAATVATLTGPARIILRDPAGGLIFNSSPSPQALPEFQESRDSPYVGDLLVTRAGEYAFPITVPVIRDGLPRAYLTLLTPIDVLYRSLRKLALPGRWVATIFDKHSHVMARSQHHDEFRGYRLSEEVQSLFRSSAGTVPVPSLTGEDSLVAFRRSPLTGWRVHITLPYQPTESPLLASIRLLGPAVAWIAGLAMLMAWLFARRIARPVEGLRQMARDMGRGRRLRPPPMYVRELAEVASAMVAASINLHRRQKALAESEGRLSRALSAARIAAWEWELGSDSLTGSPGREALFGRVPGALGTMSRLLETVHPEDVAQQRVALMEAADPAGPGMHEMLYRVVWPDGRTRWLHSQGAVVDRTANGAALRMSGVVMDVTATQEAAEREKMLSSEVDHRARNVLAVVQSVLRMSRAESSGDFAATVRGRVSVLARVHTLLARDRWLGSDLQSVARETLLAELDPAQLTIQGEAHAIVPIAVQPLAMALHELATNAQRHGALSTPQGRVSLGWRIEDAQLEMLWIERSGPKSPAAPPRRGFGLKMVEGAITHQLGGRVEMRWQEEGLICTIRLDAPRVLLQAPEPAVPQAV